MSTVNANIEKKMKNSEVIEIKKDEIVCIENNKTDDKVFQVFYKFLTEILLQIKWKVIHKLR